MTFTEAAIEVLRREGKPLHFKKLTEIAVRENLLDHVGKVPDDTMADQLAAHCRLPRAERKVIPVQQGTFALAEWGVEEDPAGLEGLIEVPPEGELPYRNRERHPIPSRELARGASRSEGRPRRRDEEERRGRRFPPPAEVAYEILAGAGGPLPVGDIAATGAERQLMPDAFVRDVGALRAALLEDNRRREGMGRKPLFQLDGDAVTLVAQPEPGERVAAPAAPRAAQGAGELRRAALAALRRRLRELDGPTVEHVAMRLLEKLEFKELKVAKRGREHVVCTGKRRMGLGDVRHAIRIIRGGADAGRRDVSDLRRDLGHYGAQIGIVLSSGDAAREARGEAAAAGQLPVVLLCGEALAEAFSDAGLGCAPVIVPELDELFFRSAAELAEREEAARRARRDERDKRESRREVRPPAPEEGAEESAAAPEEPAAGEGVVAEERSFAPARVPPPREIEVSLVPRNARADEDDEDGDEGDEGGDDEGPEIAGGEGSAAAVEGAPAEPGAAPGGERRRRRRRRRRRGGRGRGAREGAAAAPGEPGAPGAGSGEPGAEPRPAGAPQAQEPAAREPSAEPPAPPPPAQEPSGGEGA
ncbi:MAG TPA: HTH domain-containing protein [Anaeromyxobacter sp.]